MSLLVQYKEKFFFYLKLEYVKITLLFIKYIDWSINSK